jgi:hypothetical protein
MHIFLVYEFIKPEYCVPGATGVRKNLCPFGRTYRTYRKQCDDENVQILGDSVQDVVDCQYWNASLSSIYKYTRNETNFH